MVILSIIQILNYKNLEVKNLTIKRDDNKIVKISGYVPYKKVEIYITNLGWKWVKSKNGYFEYYPNFKLQKFRNRVILKYNNQIYAKMVTKEK
jgi:hypothetical protein